MGHSHSADGSNRLKQNKELSLKKQPYLSFKDYSTNSPTNKRYRFKTPTSEEIEKLDASNQLFLEKQKRWNRIVLIFGFIVSVLILYWISETTIWKGFVEGFGKYTH